MYVYVNTLLGKEMERGPSSSAPRTERKFIEKNRRNHTKTLFSKLCSLLPDHTSKILPLPDQIDEAVKYIKSLQIKLEKSKEKRDKLLGRKRSHACNSSEVNTCLESPQIEIHEMGPNLDVVFITGLSDYFIFCEIFRVLHQEGAEVVHANFSTFGNSIFQLAPKKNGDGTFTFGATTISKRLKELIHGSSYTEMESQLDLWDFEFQTNI